VAQVAIVDRCLPHAIIAGSQKSGSTALFSHLLLHPHFAPPTKKELHFFDRVANLQSYLTALPAWDSSKVGVVKGGRI
jgi:hypothetical protein